MLQRISTVFHHPASRLSEKARFSVCCQCVMFLWGSDSDVIFHFAEWQTIQSLSFANCTLWQENLLAKYWRILRIRKHDYGLICLKKDIQQLLLRQRHESIIIQKGCWKLQNLRPCKTYFDLVAELPLWISERRSKELAKPHDLKACILILSRLCVAGIPKRSWTEDNSFIQLLHPLLRWVWPNLIS